MNAWTGVKAGTWLGNVKVALAERNSKRAEEHLENVCEVVRRVAYSVLPYYTYYTYASLRS